VQTVSNGYDFGLRTGISGLWASAFGLSASRVSRFRAFLFEFAFFR